MSKYWILLAVLLPALTGCASLNDAGRSEYSVEPVAVDGKTVCCRVRIVSGREVGRVKAKLRQTERGPELDLDVQGIRAFQGQAIAAAAQRQTVDAVREALPAMVKAVIAGQLAGQAAAGAGKLLAPMLAPRAPGARPGAAP